MTNFIRNQENQKHNKSAHHRRDPTTPSPYIEELRLQYPDVPEIYRPVWQCSDDALLTCEEWSTFLAGTQKLLQDAAKICHQLAVHSDRTQPTQLTTQKNKLLCAVHRLETLLDELHLSYPMPSQTYYSLAKEYREIAGNVPQLLLNTEDQVIIWTPKLSSKKRSINNIFYWELKDMLGASNFAQYEKWHCDFCHVYHPDNWAGVLDVDNYNYKPIIDALVLAFGTQDSYDNFSYSCFNLPSSCLKAGCYICVCRREEKVRFFSEIESQIMGRKQV